MKQAPIDLLTEEEREIYRWQMWIGDLGEAGQKRLKGASVLVTRVGGVGGTAALYLAAAGVGRIVLAHAGNIKKSDLHRQVLMSHGKVGQSRVEVAAGGLREVNPHVEGGGGGGKSWGRECGEVGGGGGCGGGGGAPFFGGI